jgi:hypothetical protein
MKKLMIILVFIFFAACCKENIEPCKDQWIEMQGFLKLHDQNIGNCGYLYCYPSEMLNLLMNDTIYIQMVLLYSNHVYSNGEYKDTLYPNERLSNFNF